MRKQLLEFDDVANERRGDLPHAQYPAVGRGRGRDHQGIPRGRPLQRHHQPAHSAAVAARAVGHRRPGGCAVQRLRRVPADPAGGWTKTTSCTRKPCVARSSSRSSPPTTRSAKSWPAPKPCAPSRSRCCLRVLDDLWKDHLSTMDHLRHGIHLRGCAQKNPKQEYKRGVLHSCSRSRWTRSSATPSACCPTSRSVAKTRPKRRPACVARSGGTGQAHAVPARRGSLDGAGRGRRGRRASRGPARSCRSSSVRNEQKIGCNEPCPCGSGKKYRHCHGRLD
ncbi:SEC-C metal-binding domain-containing protein [Pseudomonas aeruginosa]